MVTHYGIEQHDIDDALNLVESTLRGKPWESQCDGREARLSSNAPGISPVRAGLTAGAAAAVCGSLLNLPLHSPSDALTEQRQR